MNIAQRNPEIDKLFTESPEGGFVKGTRVMKIHTQPGDANQDGALGTIVRGFKLTDEMIDAANKEFLDKQKFELLNCTHGYFVEWDEYPGLEIFIMGSKIMEVINENNI